MHPPVEGDRVDLDNKKQKEQDIRLVWVNSS